MLLWVPSASAECLVRDLSVAIDASVQAYQDMDAQAFTRARSSANATLECLKEPVTPEVALRFHVMDALDAWLARDPDRGVLAFSAVLAINPSWTLPASLAPPDHPLRLQFQEARTHPLTGEAPVLTSDEARLRVDGRENAKRPSDRPAILQWIRRDGSPVWSGYLPAHTPIPGSVIAQISEAGAPPLASVLAPRPPPLETPKPPPEPKPPPVTLVVDTPARGGPSAGEIALLSGTGVGLVASGILLFSAFDVRSSWRAEAEACVLDGACADDPATHVDALATQEDRARLLGYACQGSAIVTLGMGVTSLLVVRW